MNAENLIGRRTFRALLVDDESLPKILLAGLLKAHPEVEVVGQAGGVAEADRMARELEPDVIFLDVQMPRRDGFALLPRLDKMAHIVLVTSHDRHALRGFEIHAFDYLLKPVSAARLKVTIQRLNSLSDAVAPEVKRPSIRDIVVVGDANRTRTLPIGELVCLQAEGNYTRLLLTAGRAPIFMLRSLTEWERTLPMPPFVRLDRSTIVNLMHVNDFRPQSRNESCLHFVGMNDPLYLGRTASSRMRASLRDFNRASV